MHTYITPPFVGRMTAIKLNMLIQKELALIYAYNFIFHNINTGVSIIQCSHCEIWIDDQILISFCNEFSVPRSQCLSRHPASNVHKGIKFLFS